MSALVNKIILKEEIFESYNGTINIHFLTTIDGILFYKDEQYSVYTEINENEKIKITRNSSMTFQWKQKCNQCEKCYTRILQ
jgi:hypothetical protein